MRIIKLFFILLITSFVFLFCSKSDSKKSVSLAEEIHLVKILNDKGKIEESLTHLETIINSFNLKKELKSHNYS